VLPCCPSLILRASEVAEKVATPYDARHINIETTSGPHRLGILVHRLLYTLQGITTYSITFYVRKGAHMHCIGCFDGHATSFRYLFDHKAAHTGTVLHHRLLRRTRYKVSLLLQGLALVDQHYKSVESNRTSGTFFCSNADDRRGEY
jgi:hypothetical protein